MERVFALDAQRRAQYLAAREPFEASASVDEFGCGPSIDEAPWIEPEQDGIDQFQDGESAWAVWIANGPDVPIQDDGESEIP